MVTFRKKKTTTTLKKYKISEIFKIPITKLLYLGIIEIPDKIFRTHLKGTYCAISGTNINNIKNKER